MTIALYRKMVYINVWSKHNMRFLLFTIFNGGLKMDISIPMLLNYIVQIAFLALGAYYFTISLFSFIPRKEEIPTDLKYHDYALIVSAHNEEQVIENLVDSLKKLDYPKDKYEIFVVADNCTDQTAEIAKDAGAVVLERFDNTKRGKGYAMEFACDRSLGMEEK